MDATVFIGPAIGAGVTVLLAGGTYLLTEGARRQRLADLEKQNEEFAKRLERTERKHVQLAEHQIKIEDLERRVATHKRDFKEDIDRIERKLNGHGK